MKPVLETPQLILREMSVADLDFIAELLAHPEVMRFWPKCYDREETANWVKRQQARYAKDGIGYWLVLEKASGRPVGQVGLLVLTVDDREEVGLGYHDCPAKHWPTPVSMR
jgi:RimJ/RimL family protein N-acetyltransferase